MTYPPREEKGVGFTGGRVSERHFDAEVVAAITPVGMLAAALELFAIV
jgi:hypothetical protein